MSITRYMPSLQWLPSYKRENLRWDLLAGLTTAIMLVPQAMAYAMLAGLPPIVGLYSSIVPLIVYALFGTSRELAVGPVAMDSLLVAAGVGALVASGQPEYWVYATMLALMMGVIQLIMGVMRLGFLVNFLSRPVISGFTSAAALIIGFSQLKHMLGVKLPRTHLIHETLWSALSQLASWSLPTVAIGVASVIILVVLKKKAPSVPRALVVVVLMTLITWGLGLDARGVSIVGSVPAGLPSPSLPSLNTEVMMQLLTTALPLALVAFMEAISVAKALARQSRYEVEPNQELIAIGLANIAGSFFRAYPVTGGFSRSAVNASAGAKTPVASIVTALLVAVALMFFTPLFYYLPNAALAAIIMTAVFGLIDVQEVRKLWAVSRPELALLGVGFVATLSLGIAPGIGVGVLAALAWFVFRTTRPHYAILGRIPGTRDFRNVKNYPEVNTHADDGVLILRMDAQLYFGNAQFLKDILAAEEALLPTPMRALIIEACANNQLDTSAASALSELIEAYADRDILVRFSHVKRPVYDMMVKTGLVAQAGEGAFFLNVHDALADVLAHLDGPDAEGDPDNVHVLMSA